MTRKHFNAIAAEIADIRDLDARRAAAEAMARVCRRFNGNFDNGGFMAACNVTPRGWESADTSVA